MGAPYIGSTYSNEKCCLKANCRSHLSWHAHSLSLWSSSTELSCRTPCFSMKLSSSQTAWIMNLNYRFLQLSICIDHWGISHLLMNGDNRSVMLFSGLTLWAVIEIIAINKREGAWIKEDTPDWSTEMINVLIATITVAVVVYLHPWLSGLPVVWT